MSPSQAFEPVAFGRVRVRLGSGAIASRWKAIERTGDVQCFTFDPEDFAIRGFDHPMERIAVDVELTEDGHAT